MASIRDMPTDDQVALFLAHASDYGVIVTDTEGLITFWSLGAEQITGWTAAEAEGQPVAMIFTAEDRAANVPAVEMENARIAGKAPDVRWHMCKSGERFFADGVINAIFDANGQIIGFGKVLRDVTERKRQTDHAERQASLLDLSYDPTFSWNFGKRAAAPPLNS